MIRLKHSDIPALRDKLLKAQNGVCPLCGQPVTKPVLDHQHRYRKTDVIGLNGQGMVRGVLCHSCNQIEGKVNSALKRFLNFESVADKSAWLEHLIGYYAQGVTEYIHPSEREPVKHLSKRNFNALKKLYPEIQFPKSGKLTAKLKPLYEKAKIDPYAS